MNEPDQAYLEQLGKARLEETRAWLLTFPRPPQNVTEVQMDFVFHYDDGSQVVIGGRIVPDPQLTEGDTMTERPMNPDQMKVGQFWRDSINHDILKVLSFANYENEESKALVRYVRFACIANKNFMGPQEMRVATVLGQPRFELVTGFWRKLWLRWRYRDSRLTTERMPKLKGPTPFDTKLY